MDYTTLFFVFSLLSTFIYFLTISGRRNTKLPPGPYPFPVIGNLLQLGDKPHRSLATLSKRYGPLMSLKLGSRTTIVVSSPDMAKEFFQTHDISFSSRAAPDRVRIVDHGKYSIVWLPAGDQWRRLRRIAKEYLFSVQRLDDSQLVREEKVQELLNHVDRCCTNEKAVDIGAVVFTTILNILSKHIFSVDLGQYDTLSLQEFKEADLGQYDTLSLQEFKEADLGQYDTLSLQEFKEALIAFLNVAGSPNLADFFPILKPLDPQGLVRRGNIYGKKLLTIIDTIIDQRLQSRSSSSSYDGVSSTNNDVLESLLNLVYKDESIFSRDDMKHFILGMFIAGTDTTSGTLEWAMAELIRNPGEMKKAKSEVTELMQNNKGSIQEMHISELPYLQSIIKETLRLHPPGALLLPHKAIQDVEVRGFIVPKNAQILCNVWAIGRDPDIWPNPEMFMPERFLEVKTDYKGQDYEFIPFGAGRRMCPGLNIAHRMLHIMLGSLIHKFDWKLEGDITAQGMDMEEKFGFSLTRKVPLMAIPIKI